MKKLRIIVSIVLILVAVVFLLQRNKAKTAEKIAKNVALAPTVSTTAVSRREISENLSLVGTVAANLDVTIVSETVGRVTAVKVKVGDRVAAGDVIVLVDDELKLANYKAAEVNYEKSKKDLQRYEALFKTNTVTASEVEGARLACKAAEAQFLVAKRQFNDTRITSPIQGVITERMIDRGGMLQPGSPVANVVDISTLKVNLQVAEKDVFKMKAGDRVNITTDIYASVVFPGRILTISDKSDDSHTYHIEVGLENNKQHPLKAGMFARVVFPQIDRKVSLSIPREALLGSRRNPQVYVLQGSKVALRDISVGSEIGTEVEVLSGLAEGERVVVSGQNNLSDGVTVNTAK